MMPDYQEEADGFEVSPQAQGNNHGSLDDHNDTKSRSSRDYERGSSKSRDGEKSRDKDKDKDRDKTRDGGGRDKDRERDREKHRERDRDRDRDHHRDRHRDQSDRRDRDKDDNDDKYRSRDSERSEQFISNHKLLLYLHFRSMSPKKVYLDSLVTKLKQHVDGVTVDEDLDGVFQSKERNRSLKGGLYVFIEMIYSSFIEFNFSFLILTICSNFCFIDIGLELSTTISLIVLYRFMSW